MLEVGMAQAADVESRDVDLFDHLLHINFLCIDMRYYVECTEY